MAQAPTPAPTGATAGGMMGGDPMAMAGGEPDNDADENVIVTICSDGQGGYMVYAGDEPESGGAGDTGDMSEEDADAMGPAGAAPAPGADMAGGGNGGGPQGQPASSVGQALKIAMDIMQSDQSGGEGSAADQFAAGYSGNQAPTPARGMPQKY